MDVKECVIEFRDLDKILKKQRASGARTAFMICVGTVLATFVVIDRKKQHAKIFELTKEVEELKRIKGE